MTETILTKTDLSDFVTGATVLATGGGGIAPSTERLDRALSRVYDQGLECRLIEPGDVPDDALVFMSSGVGGGVSREVKEKYLLFPSFEDLFVKGFDGLKWIQDQIREMDRLYPLPSWAEMPTRGWGEAAEKRLVEILGEEPFAYLLGEIGPMGYGPICRAAAVGKPVVDADTAGYRAVPEISLSTLNLKDAPVVPAVLATSWGDMLVYEKVLSWQRFEDISRGIAVSCGGMVGGMMSVRGSVLKGAVAPNTVSKSIEIGRAIRQATDRRDDPVEAAIEASGGYKLFEGEVTAFLCEEKGGFIWGESRFKGRGEFANHTFKVWFKNENQVSWKDEEPYVTCPDLICIVDVNTGRGLSNFWLKDFEVGRAVAVIGIRSAELWRTDKGLRIYNPRRFGFEMQYVPIEKFFGC